MKQNSAWKKLRWALLFAWLATGLWQMHKPMPEGTNIGSASVLAPEQDLRFLYDLSYPNAQGERISEQRIFDAAFSMIDAAQRFIVLDFFLLNDGMGATTSSSRHLSRELADHVLARKRAQPELHVLLITDPINEVYGGQASPLFAELRAAGVAVVTTALPALRDSNPAYSALWRGLIQWWGNSTAGGWLPNPFDAQSKPVTLRSWLALLNFKANHRKVLIADDAEGRWSVLVASANPHDASSAHSNIAMMVTAPLAKVVLDSELAVAHFSDWLNYFDTGPVPADSKATPAVEVSYLTEQAIRDRLLSAIDKTRRGDAICIAVFYLSERHLIDSLLNAAKRGVQVRLILDPNKDAFGLEKDGVPNRPVANELVTKSQQAIQVRWYRTRGEQFHTKLALIEHGNQLTASLGSANFTRRNLDNYNLEANLHLLMPADSALAQQLMAYFDRLWTGEPEKDVEYTSAFEQYRDESKLRYWRYRFMEATGFSTF